MRASISKTTVAIVTVMHYMSACKYLCHNKPTTSTTSPSAHKETSVMVSFSDALVWSSYISSLQSLRLGRTLYEHSINKNYDWEIPGGFQKPQAETPQKPQLISDYYNIGTEFTGRSVSNHSRLDTLHTDPAHFEEVGPQLV